MKVVFGLVFSIFVDLPGLCCIVVCQSKRYCNTGSDRRCCYYFRSTLYLTLIPVGQVTSVVLLPTSSEDPLRFQSYREASCQVLPGAEVLSHRPPSTDSDGGYVSFRFDILKICSGEVLPSASRVRERGLGWLGGSLVAAVSPSRSPSVPQRRCCFYFENLT